ncbi:MAG: zinc-dependent alcohol dehydrogenase family protein [Hyphomicrobiaceae bacterium]
MKIKAAVLRDLGLPRPYAQSKPLRIEEVDLEGPGEGEILVKVAGAGLCHSDLSVIDGSRPRPMPVVPGHEGAGVVVEVGKGVTDLAPDDHVVFIFSSSCGKCRNCARGRPNVCLTWPEMRAKGELMTGACRLSQNGEAIGHNSGISCFAEYAVMARPSLVKIDKAVPLVDAAMFGCAVQTGVGAAVNTAGVRTGDIVAVIGLGGVGLSCMLGAKVAGAQRIIAVDLSDEKLGLARQLGATDTFNAGDADCVEAIRAATDGGVDYAFEMAGSTKAMELGYNILIRGGSVVSAGLPPAGATFATNQSAMVGDEKSVKGSYMGSCVPPRDVPAFIELYKQGRLPIDRLKSGTLPLEQINEGFDRLADVAAVRQIIVFD